MLSLCCRIFWKTVPRKYKADYGIHLLMFVSLILPLLKISSPLNIFVTASVNVAHS